ncbi:MAG: BON domain-containing protein [Janthinobacterium lividum]
MAANGVSRALVSVLLAASLAIPLAGCPLILLGGVAAGGAVVATDRRTLGAQTEDHEIQVKSAAQLADDTPPGSHVNSTVFNRRVLLTGEVPDERTRRYAEAIVRNINNVQGVVNELAVRPASSLSTRSSDTFITSKVQASLLAERQLPAHYFKVNTERGVVYLMGLVTVDEGRRGAETASRVPGVMQVVKVFQYVLPDGNDDSRANTTAAQTSDPQPAPGADVPDNSGATVGAVPDSSVSSQPLDRPQPAPISNSTIVQPGRAAQVR